MAHFEIKQFVYVPNGIESICRSRIGRITGSMHKYPCGTQPNYYSVKIGNSEEKWLPAENLWPLPSNALDVTEDTLESHIIQLYLEK